MESVVGLVMVIIGGVVSTSFTVMVTSSESESWLSEAVKVMLWVPDWL